MGKAKSEERVAQSVVADDFELFSSEMSIGKGPFNIGDTLQRRYQLIRVIGSGSYGTVWETSDKVRKVHVAVKVFHGGDIGETASQQALDVVHRLKSRPEKSASLIADFSDRFIFKKRWCLVSDFYGPSLNAVLNNTSLTPLQSRQIKTISWQIVRGVAFMHRVGIIHTDIKPDNIVFFTGGSVTVREANATGVFVDKVIMQSVEIRIVDFDDAIVFSDTKRKYPIGTTSYCAPEVTLGIAWGPAVDTFSVGCVLAELASGRSLFASSFDTVERIAAIEVVIGLFPRGIVEAVRQVNQRLFTKGRPARANFPPKYICDDCTINSEAMVRISGLSHVSTIVRDPDMSNLVRRLLHLDPRLRISMQDAVHHSYFVEFRSDL